MSVLDVFKRANEIALRPNAPIMLQPIPLVTTDTAVSDHDYNQNNSWGKSQDRVRKWLELDEMDTVEEIVARAHDIIADCATGYEPTEDDAFSWRFKTKRPGKALQILEKADDRLALKRTAHQIARAMVKFGEEPRELVFDENGEVVRFKHIRSCYVWPNFDKNGNRIPGYEQRKETVKPGQGIQLADWQIVRFLYGSEDDCFGRGLFEPARSTFNRLRKVEDGMVIARIFRAYDRLKHHVPVPPNSQSNKQTELINEYKKNMTTVRIMGADGVQRQRNKPLDVPTDIYIPDDGTKKGDVTILSSTNAQLQHIDDVEYLRERLLVAAKVPRTYLNMGTGNEGALTDSGSGTEDMQFARCLRQIQAILRYGLIQFGTTVLWMQGHDAGKLGLSVDMPRVNTENFLQESKVRLNDAQAALIFQKVLGTLPPELVAKEFMSLSDADRETLVSTMKERPDPKTGEDDSTEPTGDVTVDAVVQSLYRMRKGIERTLGQEDDAYYDRDEDERQIKTAVLDILSGHNN